MVTPEPLSVWVERLPDPQVIWDLHRIFSTTAYGYLYLGNNKMILSSLEEIDALESILETVKAADRYRILLPQTEHMALAPGSLSRALAVSIEKLRTKVDLNPVMDQQVTEDFSGNSP